MTKKSEYPVAFDPNDEAYPDDPDELPGPEQIKAGAIVERERKLFGYKSDDPHEVEQARVHNIRILASTGTDLAAIAELIGLSVTELRIKYGKELKRGPEYVYGLISRKLVDQALGGDRQSQLAWLRQFGGWQEVSRKELTGAGGGPISVRNLDTAAITELIKSLTKSGPSSRGAGRTQSKIIDVYPDMDSTSGPSDEGNEQ